MSDETGGAVVFDYAAERERRQSGMAALQAENAALRKEVAKLTAQMDALSKAAHGIISAARSFNQQHALLQFGIGTGVNDDGPKRGA